MIMNAPGGQLLKSAKRAVVHHLLSKAMKACIFTWQTRYHPCKRAVFILQHSRGNTNKQTNDTKCTG